MLGLMVLNDLAAVDSTILTNFYHEAERTAIRVLPNNALGQYWPDRSVELSEILLRKEVNKGFPSLHAYSLISYWSMLENAVTDLVRLWIENEPSVMYNRTVTKFLEQAAMRSDIDRDQKIPFVVDGMFQRL